MNGARVVQTVQHRQTFSRFTSTLYIGKIIGPTFLSPLFYDVFVLVIIFQIYCLIITTSVIITTEKTTSTRRCFGFFFWFFFDNFFFNSSSTGSAAAASAATTHRYILHFFISSCEYFINILSLHVSR